MKDKRRDFIKKSASLAAAAMMGGISPALANITGGNKQTLTGTNNAQPARELVKDAGMQMCEAYFAGMQEQKIALTRQMDVLGAVAGINVKMVKMDDVKPWEPAAIKAVKEAWDNVGLKLSVIEGPPALSEKTKLGLAGRDEEIANFISFMKNLKQYGGIDTICYNWMPVIGWYRTKNDKPGRGGALHRGAVSDSWT